MKIDPYLNFLLLFFFCPPRVIEKRNEHSYMLTLSHRESVRRMAVLGLCISCRGKIPSDDMEDPIMGTDKKHTGYGQAQDPKQKQQGEPSETDPKRREAGDPPATEQTRAEKPQQA
ncbi:hypothetical protein [Gemmobacter lutimaris]|uniref:hypothetical protein n=1 Tax=Gemmobacter lutimaris TaxID=2306023 RepID=UPI0011C349B7|nr:hypothetical protein [Gemmobacter lutimaris]